ncbi:hypothetical protein HZF02_16755 [Pseudomonas yamanorum]|nr:hypothetical protein HZF02_16755 [Pseudomonas yamanorum]
MSFGISVTGDAGAVTISSENKVLVFSERGRYNIVASGNRVGVGTVTFVNPIRTQEAPQIFIRIWSASGPSLAAYFRVLGGPGNWTGFQTTSGATQDSQLHDIEYVACKFSDSTTKSSYGLQIYDESGGPIFSSDDRVVRYKKFTKSWRYIAGTGPGVNHDTWKSDVVIDATNDFICISSMDGGPSWYNGIWTYTGLQLMSGGVRLLDIDVQREGTNDQTIFNAADSYFAIPICQFPIERYYNQ